MVNLLTRQAILFLVLAVAQAVVLGRIHLFHCATPLLYVYFVLMMPRNFPQWGVLLWSFALGLTIDIFTNTPGLAAASMTLIGVLQPYLIELFVPRDSAENLEPSLTTLGPVKYANYAILLTLLYCLVFYSLELFSFYNILHWVLCVVGSTLLTLLLIFTFEIAGAKGNE
jgi:rod shape-determining protein MreD